MIQKIKTLQIIHLALCIGLIVAYIAIGDILNPETLKIPKIDSNSVVYFVIPIAAVILSNFLFKQQLVKVEKSLQIQEKVPLYQSAFITRMAVLEAAAFMILILKKELIILGILLIAYMIFLRPSIVRMENDFENIKL